MDDSCGYMLLSEHTYTYETPLENKLNETTFETAGFYQHKDCFLCDSNKQPRLILYNYLTICGACILFTDPEHIYAYIYLSK